MPSPSPVSDSRLTAAAAVLARWLVGLLFLWMGLNKALHPERFIELVRQYEVVTNPYLLNVIGAVLPWFEVFCGLLLIAGIAVRGCALLVLLMLAPFTSLVLRRGLAIAGAKAMALCAVKFDCGCGNGEVFVCRKLVENCLLMLIALWLISRRRDRWSARFSLFVPTLPSSVSLVSPSPSSPSSPSQRTQ
jgi:uncharacterized membrane protein YphA (DoxX/SURF4 family)